MRRDDHEGRRLKTTKSTRAEEMRGKKERRHIEKKVQVMIMERIVKTWIKERI